MALSHNPRIVTDGLVLCLDAANPKSYPGSGTTWKDLSGNGNDGTLVNGVSFFNSGITSGFTQDLTDSYIQTNQVKDLKWPDKFTIQTFFYKENETASEKFYLISYTDDGRFYFGVDDRENESFILRSFGGIYSFSTPKSLQGFNCVSLISDGDGIDQVNMKIFHNGDIVDSLDITSTRGFLINKVGNSGNINDRLLSHLEYNRALSESEIKQNFNAVRGRYGI